MPAFSGASAIQQTIASRWRATGGGSSAPDEHVAAADVDVVLQQDRDRQRRRRGVAVERAVDARDRRALAAREHDDLVARLHDAARELARVAAVVGVAHDPLDRQAQVAEVALGGDLELLELRDQRRLPSTTACARSR